MSGRVVLVKCKGKPINVNVIQVYAPTAEARGEELETFYPWLDEAKPQCKSHELIAVMRKLNAEVGSERVGDTSPFGLEDINER